MKRLRKIGIILGVIYLLGCIGLYFYQDKIIFRPQLLPDNHQFRLGEELNIAVDKGIKLNAVWIKEPDAKGVVLYLHGNKGSNRRCLRQTRAMRGNGYDIFMPDYRGYGKSDGEIISESDMHQDIQKVYDFLKQHYKEEQIIVLGYSLGTGMATHLAAHNNPQQVILVAPYLSMINLKNRWAPIVPNFLIKYPLKSSDWIPKIKRPITLFHGTEDNVIPFDSSQKIKELNARLTTLFTLEGESHRGALFNPIFKKELQQLLR